MGVLKYCKQHKFYMKALIGGHKPLCWYSVTAITCLYVRGLYSGWVFLGSCVPCGSLARWRDMILDSRIFKIFTAKKKTLPFFLSFYIQVIIYNPFFIDRKLKRKREKEKEIILYNAHSLTRLARGAGGRERNRYREK